MASSKCSSNFRNMPYGGKQSLLPPKSPFPSISPSYADYGPSSALGANGTSRSQEGCRQHQRTSSESFLIEEQPSWVEELLDEPGTPVRRGHRRASSDSFAYIDAANGSNINSTLKEEYKYKSIASVLTGGSQDAYRYKDVQQSLFYQDNSFKKQQSRGWESSLSSVTYPSGHPYASDNSTLQTSGPSCTSVELDEVPSAITQKHDQADSAEHDPKGSADRNDSSNTKPSSSEMDTKRSKQQFAQRSRVRKLQYIAELEKNVQALQKEGSEVSAEINFVDQQNRFLNVKNTALKQRLDGLAQEHVIKRMEQEMLEREIARLQGLYQHQQQRQQQQRQNPTHRRATSWDLDLRFSNLSLKRMDASSVHDTVSGSLHI